MEIAVLVVCCFVSVVCFSIGVYGFVKPFKKGNKIAYVSKKALLSEETWKCAQKIEGIWFLVLAPIIITTVFTLFFVLNRNEQKQKIIYFAVSLGMVILMTFLHTFIIEIVLGVKFDEKGKPKLKQEKDDETKTTDEI